MLDPEPPRWRASLLQNSNAVEDYLGLWMNEPKSEDSQSADVAKSLCSVSPLEARPKVSAGRSGPIYYLGRGVGRVLGVG